MAVNYELSLRTGRDTYRYLRGGMVVIVVMLFAAIVIDSVPKPWQDSISAYYYTAAHNVFVTTLCCLGIMLIVYKGSKDTEDVLLNLAGTLAFFVAFVPIKVPDPPGPKQMSPTPGERLAAINNNVGAAVVALVVAATIIAFVFFGKRSRGETTLWGNWLRLNSVIILAGFVAVFLLAPRLFQAGAHYVSAILIFAIIVVVVFINAYLVTKQCQPDQEVRERYQSRYRFIGWMMLGSVLGAVALWGAGCVFNLEGKVWDFPLFALEAVLLIEFAVFWAVQTVELWDYTDRNSLIDTDTQKELTFL